MGPIEVLTRARYIYLPLTVSGRFYAIALSRASKFTSKFSFEKSLLPNLFIIVALSLTLNSMRPYLDDFTASIRSSAFTKVPDFTFGISPFGPRTLAICLRPYICSGVAIILSKLIEPSPISFNNFSSPIISVPRVSNYSWNSLSANTAILIIYPVPAGNMHVPLTF